MKGDPEKGGEIENRDRLYFHARFGLSILRKSEKRREEETEEKSEISFRCTTGCVREKWDRREENRQSLFSLLIEKPEEEQRDDVLESDFDTVTQYESV